MTNIEKKLVEYRDWLVREKAECRRRIESIPEKEFWRKNSEFGKLQMFSNALAELMQNPLVSKSMPTVSQS